MSRGRALGGALSRGGGCRRVHRTGKWAPGAYVRPVLSLLLPLGGAGRRSDPGGGGGGGRRLSAELQTALTAAYRSSRAAPSRSNSVPSMQDGRVRHGSASSGGADGGTDADAGAEGGSVDRAQPPPPEEGIPADAAAGGAPRRRRSQHSRHKRSSSFGERHGAGGGPGRDGVGWDGAGWLGRTAWWWRGWL